MMSLGVKSRTLLQQMSRRVYEPREVDESPKIMRRIRGIVFLCGMVLLISQFVFAETRTLSSSEYPTSSVPLLHGNGSGQPWQGAAPSIQTLVVTSDGVVYAGSFGMGLFRSTNKGHSWEALNRGLTDPFLLCLAVMPGHHVYAGTMRGGVYRLSLQGEQWESIGNALKTTSSRGEV